MGSFQKKVVKKGVLLFDLVECGSNSSANVAVVLLGFPAGS